MSNIFGVKTTYHGVTFRSKLESEWAAWFDSIGMTWQYEPIKFGRYQSYTPDFGINSLTVFVEVKPMNVMRMNNIGACSRPLIVVFGHPDSPVVDYVPSKSGTRYHCDSWSEAFGRALHERGG
jgi:hypothetical protein